MDVADTVFVMELGRVIASGPPDVVRADPQVIASYLGHRHSRPATGLDETETETETEANWRRRWRSSMAEIHPILHVEAARFAYGDLVAVWDVSIDAAAGRATAVVGRNGAGKTTLLFGIAGVLPLTGGSVLLEGRNVGRLRPWDRARAGLCLVPEGKRIFRELSVEENIAVAMPRRMRSGDRRRRCDEVFDRFPMLASRRAPARRLAAAEASSRPWRSPRPSPCGRRCSSSTSRRRACRRSPSMTSWPRSTI